MIKKCVFTINIIGCAFLFSGTILFIVDLHGLLSHSFFESLDFFAISNNWIIIDTAYNLQIFPFPPALPATLVTSNS